MIRNTTIIVRDTGGTYIARAPQFRITCSCTSEGRWAAERCALKCKHFPAKPDVMKMDFSASGIRLTNVAPGTYLATWEAE